ncbi:retrovirus-related pol polyprotein from transposon TNT 1-94 [Tanacetum coccineum]
MSRDVIMVGSTMRIPLLYRGEYFQWCERFLNYLEEKTDGEAMIRFIYKGEQPLPTVSPMTTAGNAVNMRGSEYGEQDRKAAILYEYETFKATEGEQLPDTYLRYLQQNQGDVNDAIGYKKKAVVVTSDPLALVVEKTKVSKGREKVVVQSESEGSDDEDISDLKKVIALLTKAINRKKFYAKPMNNILRTSSTSSSANKKLEYVKQEEKKEDKKKDGKKRDMSKVKCYNFKKEGHFAKDCKKAKVKDYNYYKTKMLLAKKDGDEQVLLAEDQAWMESSKESSSSAKETIVEVSYYSSNSESDSEYETLDYYDNSTNYGLFVDNDDDQETFHDVIEFASENVDENHIVTQKDHDESEVDHNESEDKDHLINNLIAKVLKEENDELLAQTEILQEQLKVKHVMIDTHAECQARYAKLEEENFGIEKFKRARENQIEFAYDYRNLNASYVNEKKFVSDDYFQEIINPDFEKIDSSFQQTSSLKPYVPNVILEKIIIDLEDEVAITESENQSENDCQMVEKGCDNLENAKVIAPGMFKINVSQSVSPIPVSKTLYAYYDVNDLLVFDDVSIRNSRVSKTPFRNKPYDSLNVHSKNNLNNSFPRTLFRWFPKMQPLAEPVAKWIPKVKHQIDKISKTPNSQGPIFKWVPKHMTGNRALLTNFVENFLGTVRFANDDFAVIAGYGDGLEVAFRKSTCFVRTEDGVDLLTGDRLLNLYTISLNDIASNSSAFILAKVSSSQSWLWHQRLSHLNFAIVNNLVKNNFVRDEASEVIISFIKKTQMNLQLHVQRVRTDNGTKFKNKTLAKFFDEVGITQQFSATRSPQQDGVVERRN